MAAKVDLEQMEGVEHEEFGADEQHDEESE